MLLKNMYFIKINRLQRKIKCEKTKLFLKGEWCLQCVWKSPYFSLSSQMLFCRENTSPLCHVSPYSPPPLMLATARTPPMCLTKISLDTLKNSKNSKPSINCLVRTPLSPCISKKNWIPKNTPSVISSWCPIFLYYLIKVKKKKHNFWLMFNCEAHTFSWAFYI